MSTRAPYCLPEMVHEQHLGIKAAFSLTPKPCTLAEALPQTAKNLENTAFNIATLIDHKLD